MTKISLLIIIISIVLSYLTYRYVEFYARKQKSYKFSLTLLFIVLISGLSIQYVAHFKSFINRGHFTFNPAFEKQFLELDFKNTYGTSLAQKILGTKPISRYILATSDDLEKKYIAIIGDSHAFASYYGFSKVFKDKGFETILIANSACPPYVGGVGGSKKEIQECTNKTKEIYTFISQMDNIKKLIFISRGTYYLSNSDFNSVKENIPMGFKFISYYEKKNYNHKQEFNLAIEKTFQFFNENKKIKMYYLLENPELNFLPRNYMQRPFFESKNKNKLSYTKYKNRQKEYRKTIMNIAKKFDSITILDSEKIFCDNSFCYAIKDNKMLYRNDDHLSNDGSLLQAEGLKKYIFN